MLIVGGGERGIDRLLAALLRRNIDSIVVTDDDVASIIGRKKPNLVLLVGDAALDAGAAGLAEIRRLGSTPVVVATDSEPLEHRLAPFHHGASGVLVRRENPDEMAGELQHLLAENARRVAEISSESEIPTAVIGLRSRELQSSPTPHEGITRPILPPRTEVTPAPPPEIPLPEITDAPVHEPRKRTSSSSALLVAPAQPRAPIEDRASTLRAQAMARPKASVRPAFVGLVMLVVAVALIVLSHGLHQ